MRWNLEDSANFTFACGKLFGMPVTLNSTRISRTDKICLVLLTACGFALVYNTNSILIIGWPIDKSPKLATLLVSYVIYTYLPLVPFFRYQLTSSKRRLRTILNYLAIIDRMMTQHLRKPIDYKIIAVRNTSALFCVQFSVTLIKLVEIITFARWGIRYRDVVCFFIAESWYINPIVQFIHLLSLQNCVLTRLQNSLRSLRLNSNTTVIYRSQDERIRKFKRTKIILKQIIRLCTEAVEFYGVNLILIVWVCCCNFISVLMYTVYNRAFKMITAFEVCSETFLIVLIFHTCKVTATKVSKRFFFRVLLKFSSQLELY